MAVRRSRCVDVIELRRGHRRNAAWAGWMCLVSINTSCSRAPPASCGGRDSRGGGHGSGSVRGVSSGGEKGGLEAAHAVIR